MREKTPEIRSVSGGVLVRADGTFVMNEGSVIENVRTATGNCAVVLESPQSSFIQLGGILRYNNAPTKISFTVNTWEGLRTTIANAPENIPVTIYITRHLNGTNGGTTPPTPFPTIYVPRGRNITLVSNIPNSVAGRRELQRRNHFAFHMYVSGKLTIGQNIALIGSTNMAFSGGVYVNPGGTFIMDEGSAIQHTRTMYEVPVVYYPTDSNAGFYQRGGILIDTDPMPIMTIGTMRDAIHTMPPESSITLHIGQDLPITSATTIHPGRNVTLVSTEAGVERTLTQTANIRYHFNISGATNENGTPTGLTLGQGVRLYGGTNHSNRSGGVFVRNNAKLVMNTGSVIENSRALHGYGVFLESNQATFIQQGGELRNSRVNTPTVAADIFAARGFAFGMERLPGIESDYALSAVLELYAYSRAVEEIELAEMGFVYSYVMMGDDNSFSVSNVADFNNHHLLEYSTDLYNAQNISRQRFVQEALGMETPFATSGNMPTTSGNILTTSGNIPTTITRSYTFDNRGNRVTMMVTGAENYTGR